MFVFASKPTFWWPCRAVEPDPENPGKFIEHEFEGLFEMLDPDEEKEAQRTRAAIVAKFTDTTSAEEIDAVQTELDLHDRAMTLRVLKDWRGICDEDKQPIPFDQATFPAYYKHRRVREALVSGYLDATSGGKARLGN